MSSQAITGSSGGIGLSGVLLVVFVVLKLVGVIAWSWWWVLSPLWIPVLFFVPLLLLILLIKAL
jgi:hypothetical protein